MKLMLVCFVCVFALACASTRSESPESKAQVASQCASAEELAALARSQQELSARFDTFLVDYNRAHAVAPPVQQDDEATVFSVPVGSSPVRGAQDAWVTLVEVADFQCPFCGRAEERLSSLAEHYGDDLRIVFKNNPLPHHPRAMPAAIAAACAHAQGKFWSMHDALFAHQRELEDSHLSGYAKELGLDMRKYEACLADPKVRREVELEQEDIVRCGARGAPFFFVNGLLLKGAVPEDTFRQVIDRAITSAKASGVPRAGYYEAEIVAKGKKP